ncbi:MAG TPA: hypothetical protein VN345_10345 [Blastocatellia bacterium]|nr:hypothetical protein [Blastocatellia bacterium]
MLDPQPNSPLLDPARAAFPEAFGIGREQVHAKLLFAHASVRSYYQIEVSQGGKPQRGHYAGIRGRPSLLKEEFSATIMRRSTPLRIVTPEFLDLLVFTEDDIDSGEAAGHSSKGSECRVAPRLYECCMTDEGNAFKVALLTPIPIKFSAVQGTLQAVIMDQARHNNRMDRAFGEEFEGILFGPRA